MQRRQFLEMSSFGAASFLLKGCAGSSKQSSQGAKIGFQLYTVRNEIEKDMAATLAKVAEVGFAGVETAFWPEHVTIKDAAKALKAAGLSVCSSHKTFPRLYERQMGIQNGWLLKWIIAIVMYSQRSRIVIDISPITSSQRVRCRRFFLNNFQNPA